jgi:hypothetical protein
MILNQRQAQCVHEWAGYDFKIIYQPGSENVKPDALSQRSKFHAKTEGGSAEENKSSLSTVFWDLFSGWLRGKK